MVLTFGVGVITVVTYFIFTMLLLLITLTVMVMMIVVMCGGGGGGAISRIVGDMSIFFRFFDVIIFVFNLFVCAFVV